jgi:hypothetical protein
MDYAPTNILRIPNADFLLSESGNRLKYGNDEEIKGEIQLPQGAKVVVLHVHKRKEGLTRILCFWEKKYRDGYIKTENTVLENDYDGFNSDSGKIFLNDVYHLLYVRLESYHPQDALLTLHSKVKRKYEAIIERKLFTSNTLKILVDAYNYTFKININNKPLTLKNFIAKIKEHYNPGEAFDKVFIPPLSDTWFREKSVSDLFKFYDKYILKSNVYCQTFQFNVGEVYQDSAINKFHTDFIKIIKLLKVTTGKTLSDKTPEARWLKNEVNLDNIAKNTYATIGLGDEMWKLTSEEPHHQLSAVSVNDFCGPFRSQQFITVLLHEMNVINHPQINDFFKPSSETHIDVTEHFSEIENYINGSLDINNPKDPRQVDAIFQSHSYMSLVNLALLLN